MTTRHVKLVGKKEFAAVALDLEYKTFVIYVMSHSFVALPSSYPLKEFATVALELEHETYICYVRSVSFVSLFSSSPLDIHPFCRL